RSQSWIERGATGTTQPYVRAIRGASGSGVCVNGSTPLASRIGGRFDPAAAKYADSGAPARKVARPTTCRKGSFGAAGRPPICTSSQSCGVHRRGSRPLLRTIQRESSSTAPRLTNTPPHVAWRKTSTPNADWSSTGFSAARANRSSCGKERFDCAGTPLHTAWIARSEGWSDASARCTARSWTATAPTAVIARTAAPTATPTATTSERWAWTRRRISAKRTGTSSRRRARAPGGRARAAPGASELPSTSKTITVVAPRSRRPSHAVSRGRMRVLVADDSPHLVLLYRAVLEDAGYEVVSVSNGIAAIAAVEAGEVDAAVLD